MRRLTIIITLLLLAFGQLVAQENLLINVYNRSFQSLNGKWNYIVDPYENGYYNYRYEPYDNLAEPGKGAYFTN
ncbi:MAG TPA: hypothetical protein VF298_01165, partial [Bacteroidales bacterium]